jgi:hypothetical protein
MRNARRREYYTRKKAAEGVVLPATGVLTHTNGEFYKMVDYIFNEFLTLVDVYLQCKLCWSHVHQKDSSYLNMELLLKMMMETGFAVTVLIRDQIMKFLVIHVISYFHLR